MAFYLCLLVRADCCLELLHGGEHFLFAAGKQMRDFAYLLLFVYYLFPQMVALGDACCQIFLSLLQHLHHLLNASLAFADLLAVMLCQVFFLVCRLLQLSLVPLS